MKILERTAEIKRIKGGQKTKGLTFSWKKEDFDIKETI